MLGPGLAVHCAVACSPDAQAFAREAERRLATVANSFAGTLAGSDDAGDLAWETHTEPPLPTNVTMSPSRSLHKFARACRSGSYRPRDSPNFLRLLRLLE
jgi:hypothetical protein